VGRGPAVLSGPSVDGVALVLALAGLVGCSGDAGLPDPPVPIDPATTGDGSDTADTAAPPTPTVDADQDGYTIEQGDCDDQDPSAYPGAAEDLTDGVDDDCDGLIDDASVDQLVEGDLIITEIMARPRLGSGLEGEWFEVINRSGVRIDLEGLTLTDSDGRWDTVVDHLALEDEDLAVFAASDDTALNGGLVPDHVYIGLQLHDGGGTLILGPEGFSLDAVTWTTVHDWPESEGASMSLWHHATTHGDNDYGTNWCDATSTFGDGDLGTPGQENDNCVLLDDNDGDKFNGAEDCDDDDPDVNPDAQEIWYDGVDQDCSEGSDYDADGDGHDAQDQLPDGDDCDDSDPAIHPGATDVPADGIDQDCDGEP